MNSPTAEAMSKVHPVLERIGGGNGGCCGVGIRPDMRVRVRVLRIR